MLEQARAAEALGEDDSDVEQGELVELERRAGVPEAQPKRRRKAAVSARFQQEASGPAPF